MSILEDDRAAIAGLVSITQAELAEIMRAIAAMDIPPLEKTRLLKQAAPEIMIKGVRTNEILSAAFYDEWRRADGFAAMDFDPDDFPGLSEESITSLMKETAWAAQADEGAWTAGGTGLLLLLGGALTKAYLAGRQEHYSKMGGRDSAYKKSGRVARPGACAYCIEKSYEAMALGDGGASFHRYCRCGVASIFREDSAILEPDETLIKYEQDRRKALEDLEKAGESMSTGAIIKKLRAEYGYR